MYGGSFIIVAMRTNYKTWGTKSEMIKEVIKEVINQVINEVINESIGIGK